MIGLQALGQAGKGKEAAGREKKLAYLPFVEVMDNLTAQTFLTLPLWLRWIMQELSQRSVFPLKQLTVQKQSECSLCWKCNYWTLNQWQQTSNTSLDLFLKRSGISDLQFQKKTEVLDDHSIIQLLKIATQSCFLWTWFLGKNLLSFFVLATWFKRTVRYSDM